MEPARSGCTAQPGLLRVGGEAVIRHQLSLALAAGCSRIVCVAQGIGPELIELQHCAERGEATFHVVAGPRGLSPLVTAADEVLVMADGLLPAPAEALRLLQPGPAVLVQPADLGIPAGFERIDINHASAGFMLLPGRLVERLMDLPPDADAASALLRIALHAGIGQRELPERVLREGLWPLIRTEQEAQTAEDGWMQRHTSGGALTPGPVLARMFVRRFGPAILHENRSNLVLAVTAAILVAIGVALAWFGHGAAALALAGIGWLLREAAALLERARERMQARAIRHGWRETAFAVAFDAALIAMLVLVIPSLPDLPLAARLFAPAMLIGLLWLVPRGFSSTLCHWMEDRLVLCVMLAAMALGNVITPGVPALAALLLLAGLVLARGRDGSEDSPRG